MTRVKTDDPKLENAYSFADALDAARKPHHKGMRLGNIIEALETAKPDSIVQFDFGGFAPDGVMSYRGYYSDLALGFEKKYDVKVVDVLGWLRGAVGEVFTGYKGGDYLMDRETPVWVANYGDSHGVAVVRVDDQGWRVVLRTAMID